MFHTQDYIDYLQSIIEKEDENIELVKKIYQSLEDHEIKDLLKVHVKDEFHHKKMLIDLINRLSKFNKVEVNEY